MRKKKEERTEKEEAELCKEGELILSVSSVSIKQPREITKADMELALEAFRKFLIISKERDSATHFR